MARPAPRGGGVRLPTLALAYTTPRPEEARPRLAEYGRSGVRPASPGTTVVPLQALAQLPAQIAPDRTPARSEDAVLCALARRVQEGDLSAFDQLYQLTREDVARTLCHLVGRRPDLEDLVQDTYLRLLTAVKSFRGESQFRTFLYRVCANVALSQLRWWKRRPEEPMAEVPERASPAENPEGAAERAQAARLVQAALGRLTAKKRIVFVYHELLGMGPEEIAEAVGTSPNTVRSRLHHARLEFADAMKRLLTARKGVADVRP